MKAKHEGSEHKESHVRIFEGQINFKKVFSALSVPLLKI